MTPKLHLRECRARRRFKRPQPRPAVSTVYTPSNQGAARRSGGRPGVPLDSQKWVPAPSGGCVLGGGDASTKWGVAGGTVANTARRIKAYEGSSFPLDFPARPPGRGSPADSISARVCWLTDAQGSGNWAAGPSPCTPQGAWGFDISFLPQCHTSEPTPATRTPS